ncbi:MAG: alanine racemase [Halomonas sp.]|nr:alanine racemase [Halomonas sp.]MBR2514272.1 alanine racemase [Halomonas sp.]
MAGLCSSLMEYTYSNSSQMCTEKNRYLIDLGAIRHNYRELRKALPNSVKIYACLKRNAYGCGSIAVAKALSLEGADGFATSTLSDAVDMRNSGIDVPILLYPGAPPTAYEKIERLNLTITISSLEELNCWRELMKNVRAFIKVDVGFLRSGATPNQVIELISFASSLPDVSIEGIYGHLSELKISEEYAFEQLERFQDIICNIESKGIRPPVVMLSSTKGVVSYPEMDFDAVNPGVLFVGVSDAEYPRRNIKLKPALKEISAHLVSVKKVDESLGLIPEIKGYKKNMIIGVIGFGTGDGFPEIPPSFSEVIVNGYRAPILQPAHLEHLRIDLTNIPNANFGDQVLILGHQFEESIGLEDLASQWRTSLVGLYCQLRDHVSRIYVDR